ncbi:hypothetical protein D3C71_1117750 [compost metagenome]
MRACGKRAHSSSATRGVSDSAPNTNTRSDGRCSALKRGLSICWRTNDGVDAHTATAEWRRCSTKRSLSAITSRGHSTQLPPRPSAPHRSNSEKSKLKSIWLRKAGASPSCRQWPIQPANSATLSRPICTPFGSPVLPEVNMM